MEKIGIIRKIDSIGRILIPKDLRNKYQINCEDMVEIYAKHGSIYLKKFDMETSVMERMEQKQKTTRELEEYLKRVRSKLEQLQRDTCS